MKTIYLLNGFLDVTWFILRDVNPPLYNPRFDVIEAVESASFTSTLNTGLSRVESRVAVE